MIMSRMLCAAVLFGVAPAATAMAQTAPLYVPAPVAASNPDPAATAPPTQKTAEQLSKDKSSEMICRREVETASLVKLKKTCHTREQWAYIQAETQRIGREFVLNNQNRPGGN
jgi:hypothetical protein